MAQSCALAWTWNSPVVLILVLGSRSLSTFNAQANFICKHITVPSSPFSPHAHQIFSPGSFGAWKLGGCRNDIKCPYSPCALPSSFSFNGLFLETQQNLITLRLSVPGTNLSPLYIRRDLRWYFSRQHSLEHGCIYSPVSFSHYTLHFFPFYAANTRNPRSQQQITRPPALPPLLPREGGCDLSAHVGEQVAVGLKAEPA